MSATTKEAGGDGGGAGLYSFVGLSDTDLKLTAEAPPPPQKDYTRGLSRSCVSPQLSSLKFVQSVITESLSRSGSGSGSGLGSVPPLLELIAGYAAKIECRLDTVITIQQKYIHVCQHPVSSSCTDDGDGDEDSSLLIVSHPVFDGNRFDCKTNQLSATRVFSANMPVDCKDRTAAEDVDSWSQYEMVFDPQPVRSHIMYWCDRRSVFELDTKTGVHRLVAGARENLFFAFDCEEGIRAQFNRCVALAITPDGQSLYVCDTYEDLVRQIDLTPNSKHAVTTVLDGSCSIKRRGIPCDELRAPSHMCWNRHTITAGSVAYPPGSVMYVTCSEHHIIEYRTPQVGVNEAGSTRAISVNYPQITDEHSSVLDFNGIECTASGVLIVVEIRTCSVFAIDSITGRANLLCGDPSRTEPLSYSELEDESRARDALGGTKLYCPMSLTLSRDGRYAYVVDGLAGSDVRRLTLPEEFELMSLPYQ